MKQNRILVLLALCMFLAEPVLFAKTYKRSSSSYSSSRSSSSYSSRSSSSSSYSSRSSSSFFNRKASTSSPSRSYSSSAKKSSYSSSPTKKSSYSSSSATKTSVKSSSYSSKKASSGKSKYSSSSVKKTDSRSSSGFRHGRPITGSKADKGLTRVQKVKKAKLAKKEYLNTQKKFKKQEKRRYSYSSLSTSQRTAFNRVSSYPGYNPYDYHYRRSVFMGGYHPSPYFYNAMPYRMGLWDTVALMYILENGSRRQQSLFYHNQHDPDIIRFRREMRELSRDNADLRRKLDRLERNERSIAQSGVKRRAGHIPEEIGDLAFTAEAVEAAGPTPGVLRFATGSKSGLYYKFGTQFAQCIKEKNINLNVKIISTAGTFQNLSGLAKRRYDGAVLQADGLDEYYIKNPNINLPSLQASLYKEKVFIIVRDDSGLDSIKDISGEQDEVTLVYGKGSGAELTFRNLGREDSGYKGFKYINKSGLAALKYVSQNKDIMGKKLAMIAVIGMNSDLLQTANDLYPNLKIIPYNDWDANDYTDRDGNVVYSFSKIPAVYKNLQPRGFFGGTKKVKTVEVESIFFLSDGWVKNNEDLFDDVAVCGSSAKRYIQKVVAIK